MERTWLGQAVDGDGVGFFRCCFGLLGFYPVYKFFAHHSWAQRWAESGQFNFPFVEGWPFEAPAGWLLCLVHAFMALGALGLTLGVAARPAALIYLLAYGYNFLLERSDYNNHYYLICLLSGIFACIGGDRGPTLPRWQLLWLRWQILLVYFYGGLAKIRLDWLDGNPLKTWVAQRNPALAELGVGMAHAGMFLDLLMPLGLTCRRTRPLAIAVGTIFHLSNDYLFSIGVFPWLMLAAFALFLEPGQLRRRPVTGPDRPPSNAVLVGLSLYAAIQILAPFRHHLYPGNVDWTSQGHYFAWRMKLIDRQGEAVFTLVDGPRRWLVFPEDELSREQSRSLATNPTMVMRYARHLQQRQHAQEVRARVSVSVNGWPHELLLDPEADLSHLQLLPLQSNPCLLPRTSVLPASRWLTRSYTLGYLVFLGLAWVAGPRGLGWRVGLSVQAAGVLVALAGRVNLGLELAGLAVLGAGVCHRGQRPLVFCLYQLVWLRLLWVVAHPDLP